MKKNNGFTLVELLVVIAIIGILSSAVLVSLKSARTKAMVSKSLTDLKQIQTALELYYDANGSYPLSAGGWSGFYTAWGTPSANWIVGLAPTYIQSLPREPRNTTDPHDQYYYFSTGTDYKLLYHVPHIREYCTFVKSQYPTMVDPMRDCWAYGYWSSGGRTF